MIIQCGAALRIKKHCLVYIYFLLHTSMACTLKENLKVRYIKTFLNVLIVFGMAVLHNCHQLNPYGSIWFRDLYLNLIKCF